VAPHNPQDLASLNLMDAQLPPAWMPDGQSTYLLGTDGYGRDILSALFYGARVSLLVGLVYVYLPFMVLPLYANLVKMDFRLLEAAYDLGASPFKAFWLITVPLSKAGIVAGFMLVFIPSVGEFVIPSLLGGPENIMIGRVVWDEMFTSNNWPRATALAVVMIGVIVVPLAFYYRNKE
jgi:putrescine transport system permease protein